MNHLSGSALCRGSDAMLRSHSRIRPCFFSASFFDDSSSSPSPWSRLLKVVVVVVAVTHSVRHASQQLIFESALRPTRCHASADGSLFTGTATTRTTLLRTSYELSYVFSSW